MVELFLNFYNAFVLLVGGLCLLHLVARTVDSGVRTIRGVSVWETDWLSFFIFGWALMITLVLLLTLAGPLVLFFFEDAGSRSSLQTAISAFLTPCSMLLVLMGYQLHSGKCLLQGLNSQPMALLKALREVAYLFFATLIIVSLSNFYWTLALDFGRSQGLEIGDDDQVVVEAFASTRSVWELLVLLVSASVLAPVAEELVFRAGVYRFLKRYGAVPAALVSALIFSAIHFHVGTAVPLFVLGLLLVVAYERSGHIAVPMLLHAAFNMNSILLLMLTYSAEG